jgi:hypothetical protein
MVSLLKENMMDRSVPDAKSMITETEKYVGSLRSDILARVARHEERIGELQEEIEVEGRLRAILVGFLGNDQMADRSEPDPDDPDDSEMKTNPTEDPPWRTPPSTRRRRRPFDVDDDEETEG